MSLKKKDPLQLSGGLRVAADDPHLVSLGGGRLSTAVTIHHLPIGNMSIGSSSDCGVILNGSGVLPYHCTVYRSESGEVCLVPEPDSRILIDGKKIIEDTILTQGAMITIGKSNYLRFNNPAEAQLIRSTIGSNERISMPQIDFNQDSSSSNEGTPDDMIRDVNDVMNYQNYVKPHPPKSHINETILDKMTKNDFTNINNYHSPKVFTADSITVNAPAKDVLGTKFNNFTKNLSQFFIKSEKPPLDIKHNHFQRTVSTHNPAPMLNSNNETAVLTKVNNYTANVPKLQPASACYDRYPKPGSYGNLQVYPLNGINSEINCNGKDDLELSEEQRRRAQFERMQEEEISKFEHERLEEILRMCADFERQNQNVQSSPIVQNRIKTNGSLPREKKSPFGDSEQTLFFPSQHQQQSTNDCSKPNSGYENVKIGYGNRIEISTTTNSSPSNYRYENIINTPSSIQHNGKSPTVGYENVFSPKKIGYVPQSPRTKIRTCVSPKKEPVKKTDYDLLVQSFEEKLRMEIQALRENKNFDHENVIKSNGSTTEHIYGTLEKKNRNINNLTLTIPGELKDYSVDLKAEDLQSNRNAVLKTVRNLKTDISELQRQEEEILRELDMEKALVTAELATEQSSFLELERKLSTLSSKIHRMEAQRNANRVMQETQQAKLKQTIDIKQQQILSFKSLFDQNPNDQSLLNDLNETCDSLENDQKTFEDLEFQYLEEETDWLAYREELHNELKLLTNEIEEKRSNIVRLENQGVANQNSACADTKNIEKSLWTMLNNLEKSREELKEIDKKIYEISGQHNTPHSDSEDDVDVEPKRRIDVMSQSLFDCIDLQPAAKSLSVDIMSQSVNENLFQTSIEMPTAPPPKIEISLATSTPVKMLKKIDVSSDITKISEESHEQLVAAEENDNGNSSSSIDDITDPLTKLKYNLSPPFDHKIVSNERNKVNLNLSIESDDFEVNPLEKRVPSQDDIDRICKVTSDAPIVTQGASDKVIESIKEIERNRQLLLAQQGSHVIEHERQKMNELKKRSHDEARAQYLQLQSISSDSSMDSYLSKNRSLEQLETEPKTTTALSSSSSSLSPLKQMQNNRSPKKETTASPQRHSQPDFDRTRPLSETNSELIYEGNIQEKPFKSSIDIRLSSSSNRLHENNDGDNNYRASVLSQSDTSESGGRRTTMSGSQKRTIPKHQRPLTRYLPIMSSDLDLRQHIETAGHQVTLCPHVFVDSYSCRGYLHKLGATFHGWSRRWFVLDRQKMALIYYSDKSERKPRGGAYFSTIDEVYLDHMNTSKSGRPHCTFIVKTKKRSYHLQAASDAAARIWIDAIITGAQGNIDY